MKVKINLLSANLKNLTFLFVLFCLSFSSFVSAENHREFLDRINSKKVILKEGDTLSEIIHSNGGSGLYHRGGLVDKTLWKNGISPDEAHRLPAGSEIILPYELELSSSTDQDSTSDNNETSDKNDYQKSDKKLAEKPNYFERLTSIGVGYTFQALSITSKDLDGISAELNSENFSEVGINTSFYWKSMGLETRVRLYKQFLSLSAADNIDYSQSEFDLSGFDSTFIKSLSLFKLHFGLGVKPLIFIQNAENNTVKIESANLLKLQLGGSKTFFTYKKLQMSAAFQLFYLPEHEENETTLSDGRGLDLSFNQAYQAKKWRIDSQVFINRQELTIGERDDVYQSIGARLGVSFYWD